jgi:broad specificity phosphatase PhoE
VFFVFIFQRFRFVSCRHGALFGNGKSCKEMKEMMTMTDSLTTMLARRYWLCLLQVFFTLLLQSPISIAAMEEKDEPTVTKTLFLIRHAESQENRRMASLGNVAASLSKFSLPSYDDVASSMEMLHFIAQIDSDVSVTGQRQIEHMQRVLQAANFVETSGIQVVVHSPLLRAKQTAAGMLPLATEYAQRITVVEDARLVEKTPTEWIPGNYASFLQRIEDYKDHVLALPEKRLAIVGHSQFFKAMLNLDFKFGNCEVWQVDITDKKSSNIRQDKDQYPTLSPQFSNLKLMFPCELPDECEAAVEQAAASTS